MMTGSGYYKERKDLLYYKVVQMMVKEFNGKAKSILDVGSNDCTLLSCFKRIPERYAIDLEITPNVSGIVSIRDDFLLHRFNKQFYILLCLQVLEHLDKPDIFCRKLLEVGHIIIISVPYKWQKGTEKNHLHDPIDEHKLRDWIGIDPIFSMVVNEHKHTKYDNRLVGIYSKENGDISRLKELRLVMRTRQFEFLRMIRMILSRVKRAFLHGLQPFGK